MERLQSIYEAYSNKYSVRENPLSPDEKCIDLLNSVGVRTFPDSSHFPSLPHAKVYCLSGDGKPMSSHTRYKGYTYTFGAAPVSIYLQLLIPPQTPSPPSP